MRWVTATVVMLGLLGMVPASLSQTSYFVRTDGDDTHTGLANDPDTAWKTVNHCLSTMASGDTCYVTPGTFIEQGTATLAIPAGELLSSNTGASCACTAGVQTVTCSDTTGLVVGRYMKCNSSAPGFAWTQIQAVDPETKIVNLTEGYRGTTTAGNGTVSLAKITRLAGSGTTMREVVITGYSDPPQPGPQWVQDPTYPTVWSYDVTGLPDAWANPRGFRENVTDANWNTYFDLHNGRDPYFQVTHGSGLVGCPCTSTTTIQEAVYKVKGSWAKEGSRVYVQTRNEANPTTVSLQGGTQGAANLGQFVKASPFSIVEKLSIEAASFHASIPFDTELASATLGSSSNMVFQQALQAGFSNSLISWVWTEGGRLDLRPIPDNGTNFRLEHVHSMNSSLSGGLHAGLSGYSFFDGENRGGGPDGIKMSLAGASSTDRVKYDRLFFHRSMPPIYGPGCNEGNTYNCNERTWIGPNAVDGDPRNYATHLWYIPGDMSTNPNVNHVWLQNSIFESGADGVQLYCGSGDDVWVVNNTFGTYLNHGSQLKAIVGSTAANWKTRLYNNLFLKHDLLEGAVFHAGNALNNLVSDYNLYLYYNETNSSDPRAWNSGETFSGVVRTNFNQESHGILICRTGCTAGNGIFNDAGATGLIDILPNDGTPTDYTPTETYRGLNAGKANVCPDEDFYGNPRNDGGCDIGAVELCVPDLCLNHCGTIPDGCGGFMYCGSCGGPAWPCNPAYEDDKENCADRTLCQNQVMATFQQCLRNLGLDGFLWGGVSSFASVAAGYPNQFVFQIENPNLQNTPVKFTILNGANASQRVSGARILQNGQTIYGLRQIDPTVGWGEVSITLQPGTNTFVIENHTGVFGSLSLVISEEPLLP